VCAYIYIYLYIHIYTHKEAGSGITLNYPSAWFTLAAKLAFCKLQECYVFSWRTCLCKYKGTETTGLANTRPASTPSYWDGSFISDKTWSLLSTEWDDVEANVLSKSASRLCIGTDPQLSSHASLINPCVIILPLALLALLLQAWGEGSSTCTASAFQSGNSQTW